MKPVIASPIHHERAIQEFVEATVRVAVDDLRDGRCEIGVGIDAVELARLDQRSDHGPMLGTAIGAREQCVLAIECHRPFILPMSGRSWKSITADIPILAARSSSGA